jgi:hypothetical protein
MSRHMALLMSGIITTEYFLASLLQIYLVNRFKRRTLLFVSSAGEIITLAVLAVTVHDGGHAAGIVSVVIVFLYNSFYAFGWLPVSLLLFALVVFQQLMDAQIPFVYPAEITTLRLRAKGTAIAAVGAWIVQFMVVQITPIAVQNIGYKT